MQKHNSQDALFLSYGEFFPTVGGIASYIYSFINTISSSFKITVITNPISSSDDCRYSKIKIIRPRLFTKVSYLYAKIFILYKTLVLKPKFIFITDQQSLICANFVLKLRSIFLSKSRICIFFYGTDILDIVSSSTSTITNFTQYLKKIDHYVCISQYTKKLLLKHFPFIRQEKITVCYPTISQQFIQAKFTQQEETNFFKSLKLKKQQYFLSIGRLVKRKGHEQVIKILPQILSKYPNLKYLIIGDGEEVSYLRQLASELNVNSSVIIRSLSEIEKKIALKNALFLIHPSHNVDEPGQRVEGFGIAILEALSVGIPIIATNNGGIWEIVTDNVNGYLVKPKDPKSLLYACQKMLINSNRQKLAYETTKSIQKFLGNNYANQIQSLMSKLKQKRVAYIVEWFYPIIGGAGKQALLLAKNLPNFNVSFYTKLVPGAKRKETIKGFSVWRIGPTVKIMLDTQKRCFDYQAAWQLFKQLLSHSYQIDLVHIHGNLTNNFSISAILAARLLRIPVIAKPALYGEFSGQGHIIKNGPFNKMFNINPLNVLRRVIAKKADCYLAISRDISSELQNIKIPQKKVVYLPNAIAINKLTKKPRTSTIVNFLVVSRLSSNKGLIFPLLETWKANYKNNRQLKLTIIGSGQNLIGSNEREVSMFIEKNQLSNVRLLPSQKDLHQFYQQADIFIQPSQNEGLSNALLEAASYGLIIIASKISGNIDLINSKTGFLFNQDSSESLFQVVNLALERCNLWSSYRKNLLFRLSRNYNIDDVVKKLNSIYENMAN